MPMSSFTNNLKKEKPWAIMGLTRSQYQRLKPWKSAQKKISKEQFEDLVRELGANFFKDLKFQSDVGELMQGIFGKLGGE